MIIGGIMIGGPGKGLQERWHAADCVDFYRGIRGGDGRPGAERGHIERSNSRIK